MPFPFGDVKVAYFGVQKLATIGETSGCSIETAAGGRGTTLFLFEPSTPAAIVGFRMTAVAILDVDLSVVVPNVLSAGVLANTTIRIGRESAGLLPVEPDYFYRAEDFAQFGNGGREIYVPPGNTLTLLKTTVNSGFTASLGIAEHQARPS